MIHAYSIEALNLITNKWVLCATARTFDEAFDKAEKFVGFSVAHGTVAILDCQGYFVWKSDDKTMRVCV